MERVPAAPRRLAHLDVSGPLTAGVARVPLRVPLPVVRGGYGLRRSIAASERDPLLARAVVVGCAGRRVGLVLADLVLVPDELRAAVAQRLADLRLDGLVVAATHTHGSPGAYDPRWLAEVIGMGRFRPDVFEHLAERLARAVREAASSLAPITLAADQGELPGFALNRSSPGAPVDRAWTVLALRRDSRPLALIAVVAAHPTLGGRLDPFLSADYPGAAMARLEEEAEVALVLQGAGGDAALPDKGDPAVAAAAARLAVAARESLARAVESPARLRHAEALVELPSPRAPARVPPGLRGPVTNAVRVTGLEPVRMSLLGLGGTGLLFVPGEPVAAARDPLAAALSGFESVRVVGLAQGYLGYVETPEHMDAGTGEAGRVWFGPRLLPVLVEGARALN